MGFLAEERYDSMNDRYANLFHARNENKEFRLEDHDFTIYMDTVQKDYHVSEVRGKEIRTERLISWQNRSSMRWSTAMCRRKTSGAWVA